jgi:RNA polymerase sigma-70 factor (ECF subfamily)
MEPLSPEALVRWCQQTLPDDTRAFEQLVTQYKSRVFASAYRLMGNRQDAEDQAQEVFLKIYRGIKTLEDPATLPAWITRITVNTCLDALAKQRRRPQMTSLTPPNAEDGEEMHVPDQRTPTPETAVLRRELQRCLEETLAQMDPNARAVLVLRDVEDHSYQEIAEALAVGLSAVKMRIQRARLAFQKLLDTVCPGTARAAQTSGPSVQTAP